MALRPVDVQQVLAKLPDAMRDSATQQAQPAAAQQALAGDEARRHEQLAQTVHGFDESGMAAVHERNGQASQEQADDQERREDEQGDQAGAQAPGSRAPQVRLGRHIDLQV